jgi:hypothetical protein
MSPPRPSNLHPSRSFTRLESAPKSQLSRSRASTLQGPHVPTMLDPLKSNAVLEEDEAVDADVFVKKDHDDDDDDDQVPAHEAAPDSFEELPIEIRSLTERYRTPWHCQCATWLTARQVSGVSHCQSPSDSSDQRQPLRPLPRLLHARLLQDQYSHSHAFSTADQRYLSDQKGRGCL